MISLLSHDPATLKLTVSFHLTAYLSYRCWTPPNPNPALNASHPKDSSASYIASYCSRNVRRTVASTLWFYHMLITLLYPIPRLLLCPNPSNLSRNLFTWSPCTAIVLTLIFIAAPISLLAFKQLGHDFTFSLAKPKRLVKTGLCKYVQHPSYPASWLVYAANSALLLKIDGALGCVLPSSVVGGRVVPIVGVCF